MTRSHRDWRGSPQPGLLLAVLATLLFGFARPATASVALLLEEPYGGMGSINPTGHAALYFDHICAQTPVQLRPCAPGELGAVISRYDGITRHDWIAVPLIPYLYSVANATEIPVRVNRADVARLRDNYRRAHLESIAPDNTAGETPAGNWYELVGSTFDRSLYGFQVNTTAKQDADLIALFNDRKNSELYNGMFRNCADFARTTLNRFYPHMVRRNFIADLGMTTPKSVARALTHYAAKHPEAGLVVFAIPQLSGDIARSQKTQDVAEGLLKEYGVPLVLLSPVTTGIVLAAYVGHGRFAEPRHAPTLNLRPDVMMEDAFTATPAPQNAAGTALAENWTVPTMRLSSSTMTATASAMAAAAPATSTSGAQASPGPKNDCHTASFHTAPTEE